MLKQKRDVSSDEEGRITEITTFANIPIPECGGCPFFVRVDDIAAKCGFYRKTLGDPDLNCSVTKIEVTEKA